MSKGDHIRVNRGIYYHHGIDIGNDRVIHYIGREGSKKSGVISETSKMEFLAGGKEEVVQYKTSFPKDEVIRRAKSKLGEEDYLLFGWNCEHFSTWCKCGKKASSQVEVLNALDGVPIVDEVLSIGVLTYSIFELIRNGLRKL